MGITRSEKTRRVVLLLAPCILIITMILSIGSAYGRYITALSGDNTVTVRPKEEAYVAESEWTGTAGTYIKTFAFGNAEGEDVIEKDLAVRVRLFAPADAESLTVMLEAEGKVFVANVYQLSEKTPMFNDRGEGNVYKFLDANGEELSFFLEGGQATQYEMAITVLGADSTEGFMLDADTTQTR